MGISKKREQPVMKPWCCFRISHFSGLLELAEKEKHRHKKRATAAEGGAGLTEEEVQARQQAADLQMAALIAAEETQKVLKAA